MTVTATNLLAEATTSGGSSYTTTASITPAANKLILAAVVVSVAATPTPTVSLSGCGLTWVQVGVTDQASNIRTAYLFRAMGPSPTAGQLTATLGSAATSFLICVDQLDATDTSGTDGSGAISEVLIYNTTAGDTSVSATFAGAVDPANAVYAAIGVEGTQELVTPGSGYTALGQTFIGAPSSSLLTEFDASGTTTVTAGPWTGVTNAQAFLVAVEVAAAAAPPSPPVSSFTATPTSGQAPLQVAFTDTSTGTPTSWAWDFGDGGTSTAQNPTYTYAAAGSYTATLTASNAGGPDATPATASITVTAPPAVGYQVYKLRGGVYVAAEVLRLSGGTYL